MDTGYSRAQIILHWIIVLLVALQFFTADSMVMLWHAISGARTEVIPYNDQLGEAWHMSSGLTILFLSLMLVMLRRRHGTPALRDMPPALAKLALWTHRGLYGVVIALPVVGTGAAAGVVVAAWIHVVLTRVLLVLIGLHVLGALWHLLVRRDGVMRSMVVPRDEGR